MAIGGILRRFNQISNTATGNFAAANPDSAPGQLMGLGKELATLDTSGGGAGGGEGLVKPGAGNRIMGTPQTSGTMQAGGQRTSFSADRPRSPFQRRLLGS